MTKYLITLITCVFLATGLQAQNSNLILFTENGEKFYAILNGVRQNDKPETNVKITDLNANFYKLKVIFDDAKLGEKNFNVGLNPGTETSVMIKFHAKKNEYVLRPVSETPIAEALPPAPNQTVVVYSATPAPASTSVTQTTTTTTGVPGENVNMSVGVNMGDMGGGINVNVSGGTTHTTTQTTTTTVSHSHTIDEPVAPPPPPPAYLPGYNGPYGCPVPMAPQDFESLKQTISSKSFEDSKMTIAKQVLQNNCLLTSQVKQIMGLFTYEQSKLDFAKYAYGYTYDIGNYFKVNDMFTFESSIDDLNEYISSQRR